MALISRFVRWKAQYHSMNQLNSCSAEKLSLMHQTLSPSCTLPVVQVIAGTLCAQAGSQVQGMGKIMKPQIPSNFLTAVCLTWREPSSPTTWRVFANGRLLHLNQPGRQDMSLLWFAIQPGQLNTEAVKTLVSLGADPAANPIKDLRQPARLCFHEPQKSR